MKLTIEMPWEKDLSVNHMRYGKGGGYRKKPHVQDWIICVESRIWVELVPWLRTGEELPLLPVAIKVDFRFPDKRRRDDHNWYKVICDAVAAGLGIDDRHIRISTGSVTVDKQNAGFTITVEDRQDETTMGIQNRHS